MSTLPRELQLHDIYSAITLAARPSAHVRISMRAPGCRTSLALPALLTAVTGFLPGARAQDYPNRPVRLMTDSAPGSAIDVPVRLVAEGLSRIWGQQAVVIAAQSAIFVILNICPISFVCSPPTLRRSTR